MLLINLPVKMKNDLNHLINKYNRTNDQFVEELLSMFMNNLRDLILMECESMMSDLFDELKGLSYDVDQMNHNISDNTSKLEKLSYQVDHKKNLIDNLDKIDNKIKELEEISNNIESSKSSIRDAIQNIYDFISVKRNINFRNNFVENKRDKLAIELRSVLKKIG